MESELFWDFERDEVIAEHQVRGDGAEKFRDQCAAR